LTDFNGAKQNVNGMTNGKISYGQMSPDSLFLKLMDVQKYGEELVKLLIMIVFNLL